MAYICNLELANKLTAITFAKHEQIFNSRLREYRRGV